MCAIESGCLITIMIIIIIIIIIIAITIIIRIITIMIMIMQAAQLAGSRKWRDAQHRQLQPRAPHATGGSGWPAAATLQPYASPLPSPRTQPPDAGGARSPRPRASPARPREAASSPEQGMSHGCPYYSILYLTYNLDSYNIVHYIIYNI